MNRISEGGEAWLASPEVDRPHRWRRGIALARRTAAVFAASAFAANDRAGNGPGPAANGPGPGCNIIPPEASIGTKVDISEFPPADSLTDRELAGPVQLLRSGKFDLPIEKLTSVNVASGNPRGTITLPLFKGAVNTPTRPNPAWYIILDAGNQAEAERLGVNFSKKLPTPAHAPPPTTRRADGTFLFESGVVDFSPDRVVVAGSEDHAFPPGQAQPGSVADADYSPLVS